MHKFKLAFLNKMAFSVFFALFSSSEFNTFGFDEYSILLTFPELTSSADKKKKISHKKYR